MPWEILAQRRHARRRITLIAVIALAASAYSACSASGGENTLANGARSGNPATGGSAGSGGSRNGGSGGSRSGNGGTISMDSGFSTDGSGDANCGAQTLEATKVTMDQIVTEQITERAPADVFIMFDQSASMNAIEGGSSRWVSVTQAAIGFVQSKDSAGLGVGIQFFGKSAATEDCSAATYARPEVPIAVLPGNAGAIVGAINGHSPTSETPTTAALTGAITYARQWKTQNPTHPVFVLLVTDGVPEVPISMFTSCFGSTQDIPSTAAAATSGFSGTPSIPTYVLGVGPSLANLDQIAAAGGTQKAYLISGGNVSQQVVDALNTIRGTISHTVTRTVATTKTVPLECEWVMPTAGNGQAQDANKVNVRFTAAGAAQPLGMVASQAECATHPNAWYYDNPASPTKIIACPSSCDAIKAASDGRIDILVGCDTIPA